MAATFDIEIKGRTLAFQTTSALFSPVGLDAGTAALLSTIDILPSDKVLDLGCGYGPVGIFAATQTRPDLVHMIDIDPQAVALARANAERNGAIGINTCVSDGFRNFHEKDFDKIISHPPYHVDFAVPKHFIEKGFNRLKIGGSIWMVTKRDLWYRNKLKAIFGGVKVQKIDGYSVFSAERRSPNYANTN